MSAAFDLDFDFDFWIQTNSARSKANKPKAADKSVRPTRSLLN